LRKTPNFFAENCQKSQKIVNITSTPDWENFRLLGDCFLWAVFENYSSPDFGGAFFLGKNYTFSLVKHWVGLQFGPFFANSSGHPDYGAINERGPISFLAFKKSGVRSKPHAQKK
jgi:hypothetical protein